MIKEKELTEQEQQDIEFFASQLNRDKNLTIFKSRYYHKLSIAVDHIEEKENDAYPFTIHQFDAVYYPKADKIHFKSTSNKYEKNGLEYLIKNIL